MTLERLKWIAETSTSKHMDKREDFLRSVNTKGFRYYNFLYLLSMELKPTVCVELGTNTGRGALNLKYGYPPSLVYTVDIIQNQKYMLERHNIVAIKGDSVHSSNLVPTLIDILFIDSLHQYYHVALEWSSYLPKVRKGGIIILDDIHLDKVAPQYEGMERFWNEIKLPKIDLTELHHPAGFGAVINGESNDTA